MIIEDKSGLGLEPIFDPIPGGGNMLRDFDYFDLDGGTQEIPGYHFGRLSRKSRPKDVVRTCLAVHHTVRLDHLAVDFGGRPLRPVVSHYAWRLGYPTAWRSA
jgi:hypothetical protein